MTCGESGYDGGWLRARDVLEALVLDAAVFDLEGLPTVEDEPRPRELVADCFGGIFFCVEAPKFKVSSQVSV